MAQVSPADVRAVLRHPPDDVGPYLHTATELVSLHLSGAALPASILYDITKYLAAHLAELASDPRSGLGSERIGEWSASYTDAKASVDPRLGALHSTGHGRTAIALDASGTLGELGRPVTRFAAL